MVKYLKKFYRLTPDVFKRRFHWMSFLSLPMGLAELVSLGAIVPFVVMIVSPEKIVDNEDYAIFFNFFGFSSSSEKLVFIYTMFVFIISVLTILKNWYLKYTLKFSYDLGNYVSTKLFENQLKEDYVSQSKVDHNRKVSNVVDISNALINALLTPLASLIQSFSTLAIVFTAVTLYDFQLSILAIFFIIIIYLTVNFFNRKELDVNSKKVNLLLGQQLSTLNQSFSALKDIIINRSYDDFIDLYREKDRELRDAHYKNNVRRFAPKYYIETLGVIVIATLGVALVLISYESTLEVVAFVALMAQRLLPICQQFYMSIAAIQGSGESIRKGIEILQKDNNIAPKQSSKCFKNFEKIVFEDVGFYYRSGGFCIQNLNFCINKGEKIGICGPSGMGKTTLVDLICGLLAPVEGTIRVNNVKLDTMNVKDWLENFSYVSQNSVIYDDSIKNNICKISPKDNNQIDQDLYDLVKFNTDLSDWINSKTSGDDYQVGYLGSNISGGQKQRIGIARSLYSDKKVLIFDESTSQLDVKTEAHVINQIYSDFSERTIITIAHRLNSLKYCDRIFYFDSNGLRIFQRYSDFIDSEIYL